LRHSSADDALREPRHQLAAIPIIRLGIAFKMIATSVNEAQFSRSR
jgi:hypothetical protein